LGDLGRTSKVINAESRAVIISGSNLGGIIGFQENGFPTEDVSITGSRSTSIILQGTNGSAASGGLVGRSWYRFSSTDNYSAGIILSSTSEQGGLVGRRDSGGTSSIERLAIVRNYSSTLIFTSGGSRIGGLIGLALSVSDTNLFSITDSFSLGRIISTSSSRANLVGRSEATGTTLAGIFSSHYLVQAGNPAPCLAEDLNTNTNQQCNLLGVDYSDPATFTTPGSAIFASWDFTSTWKWPSGGGAPILQWELDDTE
jgi:hypothetical protein